MDATTGTLMQVSHGSTEPHAAARPIGKSVSPKQHPSPNHLFAANDTTRIQAARTNEQNMLHILNSHKIWKF
jgi:hypothetical protein